MPSRFQPFQVPKQFENDDSKATSENTASQVSKQLDELVSRAIESPPKTSLNLTWVSKRIECSSLWPSAKTLVDKDGILVERIQEPSPVSSQHGLAERLAELHSHIAKLGSPRFKNKVVGINTQDQSVEATSILQTTAQGRDGSLHANSTWLTNWTQTNNGLQLERLQVIKFESVRSSQRQLMTECTPSLFGGQEAYEQFLRSTQSWARRIETRLGSSILGSHGIAIGDVNGDGLEDIYVCQPGGIPNRLLLHQPDGSVRDGSAESGVDIFDSTRSALLVDLDNDGDQDLVAASITGLLFYESDGNGHFVFRKRIGQAHKAYSIAAADYDADGLVDVYACLYHPPSGSKFGHPVPYHDATNGSPNVLMRNAGNWEFVDVTKLSGLDKDNRRWSFAAAWEDYDNDGDVDLYVANDFGRNCLYENRDGLFTNIAEKAAVEDVASGMSVSWGDVDRDGWMDVHVGNMFSAAGHRVTYQDDFKSNSSDVKSRLQRLARGNTLYRNQGDGVFEDVSLKAGITMGRWAWSSNFVDLNNDGWQDLLVANGYMTGEDADDL